MGPEWFEPGPPEQVTFNGKVDDAAISPDGNYLAYTTREGGKGILHTMRTMQSPIWIPGRNVLAFSGITDWRTNQQTGPYEVAANTVWIASGNPLDLPR